MAITWSGAVLRPDGSNGFRLGHDFTHTWAPDYSSVTLAARIYVGTMWARSDSSNAFMANFDGWVYNGEAPFKHTSSAGPWSDSNVTHVHTLTRTYTPAPGQSVTMPIYVTLSGVDTIPGTGTLSASTTAVRPAVLPSTPAAPSVSSISNTAATVSLVMPYNGGSAIIDTGFWLYTSATSTSVVKTDGVLNTATSFTFTELSPATTYYAEVAVGNSVGWSSRSARTAFTTLPNAPTLQSAPSATNVSRTSFTVPTAVIANNGGAAPTNYRVEVSKTDGTDTTVFTANGWLPISVTGRAPLTQYSYRVAAYNSGGWGPYTSYSYVTTLNTSPSDPLPPTIAAITEVSATATWTAPALNDSTLTGYVLRVCNVNDPDAYTQSHSVGPAVLSKALTGLTKATTYYVFVKALATPNDSGWSPAGIFKTSGTVSTLFPYIKIAGVWRSVEVWQNVGGVWRRAALSLNVNGVWKKEVL